MTDNQDMRNKQGNQPHDEPEQKKANPQNESGKPATPDSSNHEGHTNDAKDTGKNKKGGGSKSSRVKPLGEQDKSPNSNDDIAEAMSSRDPAINQNLKGA